MSPYNIEELMYMHVSGANVIMVSEVSTQLVKGDLIAKLPNEGHRLSDTMSEGLHPRTNILA